MRAVSLLSVLVLCVAPSLDAQTKTRQRDVERFDVSGVPATPTNEREREILLLVQAHRKGDLTDATRIQMLLAQYYKQKGDAPRADDCNQLAADAYNATTNSAPETAGAPGKPPFDPQSTFRRTFVYTDEQRVEHTWDFFLDGSFSHTVNNPVGAASPPETGWYTRHNHEMRLWQLRPNTDRTVDFRLRGPDGSEGATMDGVSLKPAS
jgi:hypothetical protein